LFPISHRVLRAVAKGVSLENDFYWTSVEVDDELCYPHLDLVLAKKVLSWNWSFVSVEKNNGKISEACYVGLSYNYYTSIFLYSSFS
jgi:hypothetical protein